MSFVDGFLSARKQQGKSNQALQFICLFLFASLSIFYDGASAWAQSVSTPVLSGYRDFTFGSGSVTSEPTEEKPESKLWYNDGFWWGVMWDQNASSYRIYRYDKASPGWFNVGPNVDERGRSAQDVLWDAANNKLYIASHAKLTIQDGVSNDARLYRFSYNSSTDAYSLDAGFPVVFGTNKSRALVIAKDSNGKLWATWTHNQRVWVNRTTAGGLSNDASWGTPFELPGQGNNLLLGSNGTLDISSIVDFGGNKIGVLWGNQSATDEKYYFAFRNDSDADTTWQPRETAYENTALANAADDHINLTCSPSSGVVLAAVKHETNNGSFPIVSVLKRDHTTGVWTAHTVATKGEDYTRPLAMLDSDTDSLYVFAQSDDNDVGPLKTVFYKVAHINNLNFPSGHGRIFLRSPDSGEVINNVTSSKECVNAATGLLVLASDDKKKHYFHNYLALGGNARPIAVNDAVSTGSNTPGAFNVTANDIDDGSIDVTTVAIVSNPSNGAVSVNSGTGMVTYTPNGGFTGMDSFLYTVRDNDGESAIAATVTVTVQPAPVAGNDAAATDEDNAVAINVLSNDTDANGAVDSTTVTVVSNPSSGSTSIHPTTGEITYTPNANFNGSDSFTYTVKDNDGATSNAATVTVTVNDINDPPVAGNDAAATSEDTPVAINVTANDSDIDGSLNLGSVTVVSVPAHGAASVNTSTGVITYTPNLNYHGSDSFTYRVSDDDGASSNEATVNVTIGAVVDPPVAQADAADTDEDNAVTLDVLANDSDSDGLLVPSTVTVASPPSNGAASVNSSTGAITYTPNLNFFGSDSFTYTVKDDDGASSNAAAVSITINAVNDPPAVVNDAAATPEDVGVEINVLSNDTDVDGSIVASTVVVASPPSNGTTSVNSVSGRITYTPNLNFHGVDAFTYTVADNDNAVSSAATVTITVNDVNDPPVAANDGATTEEDTPVDINVTFNDFDVDGALNLSAVTIIANPTNGTVSVNPTTGVVTYTPSLDYIGPDSFTYTVKDDDGAASNVATVSITVTGDNDPPVAQNDAATTNEEVAVNINVLANDSDVDGTLNQASVTVTAPSNGTATVSASGVVTYTPDLNFFGTDSFTYTVKDNLGAASNVATVTVTVNNVNDPPVAADDAGQTNEGFPVTINVVVNDTDLDGNVDPTTVAIVSPPANGATAINSTTGAITYTPNANFSGAETFTYRVQDNSGANSNAATVTIAVNDAPVAVNDEAVTTEDSPIVIEVLANDSDSDGALVPSTVSLISGPANGAASVNPTTGAITYTPNTNFFGTNTFTYRVQDNLGANSNTATVTVIVNREPFAANDSKTTDEDVAADINVIANDVDLDGIIDPTTVVIVTDVTNGATSVNPATGVVTYTPNAEFSGSDSFTYNVKDNRGTLSNNATVSITVNPVNDPPVANNDAAATDEESPVAINVTANDTDIDGAVDVTTVTIVSQPANGAATVNPTNGVVTYTPNVDFFGSDSFTYTVKDNGSAASNVATVTVTVSPDNDAPVAVNDTSFTNEDQAVAINVIANDTDIDGNIAATTVTIVDGADNGATSVNPITGVVNYTPNTNFSGVDSFTYTVRDNDALLSNTATVTIFVNDVPAALNDAAQTNENVTVEIDVLANDADLDGTLNPASVVAVTQPANGSLSINPVTGAITYTPNTNFSGVNTFSYTVKDNDGATSNQALVTVTVNDLPVAANDAVTTDEDTPANISVLANDSDSDGALNPASIIIVSNTSNGSTSLNTSTGVVTYTPNANFSGSDSFTYTVNDDDGATSNLATVTITVTEVNDPPVANNDAAGAIEDTPVDIDVKANDTDVDGIIVSTTVAIVASPAHGSTSVNPTTGVVTYTPNLDFTGADSFTYTIKDDDNAASNIATVTVNVADENDPPVANNDNATTPEDTPVSINILANDSDVDGSLDKTTVTITTPPTLGAAAVNPTTGVVTYTPNANVFGSDSFVYTVKDNLGLSSNHATVSITVNSVNDAPLAVNDMALTNKGASVDISVTANDSDVDGAISANTVSVTAASNGTTSLLPGGVVRYTPFPGFTGTDSFNYTVKDNLNALSNEATVIITVNDFPVAVNDAAATNKGVAVAINVIANDSDADGAIDPTSVTVVSAPANGATSVNSTTGEITYTPNGNFDGADSFTYTVKDNHGAASNAATVTISVNDFPVAVNDAAFTNMNNAVVIAVLANDSDADGAIDPTTVAVVTNASSGATSVNPTTGEITYTPNTNFFGNDTFTYNFKDNSGATSNTATVTVEVNAPPIAVNDAAITNEDASVNINPAGNDSDPDGTLNFTTVTIISNVANGTTSVHPTTGVVTYTPNANYFGSDSFTYTIKDNDGAVSNTATVSITVVDVNDPPVAVNDGAATPEDTPLEINVTANDSDIDGSLNLSTVTVITPPANGATSVNPANGVITYTPNLDFEGVDTFTYTVADDDGAASNAATVTVNVAGDNDPPVAQNDAAVTDEDVAVEIAVTTNDSDVDGTVDPATVAIQTQPTHGTTAVHPTTGVVTYTPAANYFGSDSFTYNVKDNLGFTSNIATATITINDVNDPPVAVNDAAATGEETPVEISVTNNDSDIDGALDLTTVIVVTPATNGATTVNPTTGVITYTPNLNFEGADTFTYTVNDDDGAASNIATVTVTVSGDNDPPVAVNDTTSTNEETAVQIAVTVNDSDVDGTIDITTVAVATPPANGNVSVNSISGVITYTPNVDFVGNDTFTYTVKDNLGFSSNVAAVLVSVINVNDPPVAVNDASATGEETPVAITATSNDTDVDGAIDVTTVAIVTPPANGAVAVNPTTGVITYSPNLDFEGVDTFTYTVQDDSGAVSNPATVTVNVSGDNDPPVAVNDTTSTNEDVAVEINVIANDSDVDGAIDATTVTIQTPPAHGAAGVNPTTGVVTYTPAANYFGSDSFTYLVKDNLGFNSNIAAVLLTIHDVNDAPVAVNDDVGTAEETPVVIDVLANDTDVDGVINPTTVTIVTQPTQGVISLNATTGVITYTPGADFVGVDSLAYLVADDDGASSNTAKVTIIVSNENDPPAAVDDAVSTDEDTPIAIAVLSNDFDIDGALNLSSVAIITSPANGSAAVNSTTGEITYTPNANFFGSDLLTYTVKDNSGFASNAATVFITIDPVNDPPIAANDAAVTEGGVSVNINVIANDTDIDHAIDPTTVAIVTQPTNGSVSVNSATGEVTYAPNANFGGADAFTYRVSDTGGAQSNVANVIVTVHDKIIVVHDAYVRSSDPTTNFGGGTELRARKSVSGVLQISYLKFNVTGITTPIISAKIRLLSLDPTDDGGSLFVVSNNFQGTTTPWDEGGIIYNNRPAVSGSPLVSLGSISAGQFVEFDVSSVITGDGVYSFAITSNSDLTARFSSKEVANGPALILQRALSSPLSPVINSFSPVSGLVGSEVTVSGDNFSNANNVAFNGISAAFIIDSNSQIRATVPAGATTGKISVTNPEGSGMSSSNFLVILAPAISSFTPTSGPVGTQVTISGANLTAVTNVSFNGLAAASFTVVSDNEIRAAVPAGASSGVVLVQNAAGTATSSANFTVILPPTITSFNPTSGPLNTEVTVTGTNFVQITQVSFNGAAASIFEVDSDAQLRALVPAAAVSGPITVSNAAGNGVSASNFVLLQPPTISSFTPAGGLVGAQVTITGSEFASAVAVHFNGLAAAFNIDSNTQIRATVPTGATNGPISVTNSVGTGISTSDFIISSLPTVSSFIPTSGAPGTEVTITGSTFSNATTVTFGGVNAPSFFIESDTQIRATVPNGAITGKISVSNVAGGGESVANFIVLSGSGTVTLQPIADAYVRSARPDNNYGGGTEVRARNANTGEITTSFLKFNVTGVSGGVTSAKIRLMVLDNSNQGGSMFSVSNNFLGTSTPWTEDGLNFNNAPAISGSPLSSLGSITFGSTVEFDVTSAITGNGVFSFGLTSTSNDAARYHSKENANPPELVIETGGASPNAPAISSFNPPTGVAGTEVTITGSNFTGATLVLFNGVSAASFVVDSNSQIRAFVNSGTTSGKVSVTTANGTGLSASDFTIVDAPTITSFTPTSGPAGTVVTVSGTNFLGATAVQFNGLAASSFTIDSSTQLRATVANGSSSGLISVTNAAGNANSATAFTVVLPPTVSSFTPTSGPVGTLVTITGTNFLGVSSVTFNGVASTNVTVDSATQIRAAVPVGAASGKIAVTNSAGSAQSVNNFTIVQSPLVSAFTPTSGIIGVSVTITGNNFISVSDVSFNGAAATFTVDSPTQIRATVPDGATTGVISVTNAAGAGNSSANFTVILPPSISSFDPTNGVVGASITISGSNFAGTSVVQFNGVAAASFTIDSNSQIRAVVPSGAGAGPISVQNAAGTAVSAANFTVIIGPAIASFNPASAPIGTEITITGSNFDNITQVAFNGAPAASFIVDSATQIRATVPSSASTGPVSVTNAAATAVSSTNFIVQGPPSIISFTPTQGIIGSAVTITGANFNGATSVAFNGISAAFTVDSDAQVRATVPIGGTTGVISVTNNLGAGNSSTNFTVILPPSISSFAPTNGPVGSEVTISGANFTGATGVLFNGIATANFTVDSETQIRAAVPSGATTGPVSVANAAGSAVSAANFTITTVSTTFTFNPTDDAYVRSDLPTRNHATSVELRVRRTSSADLDSYLKFSVTGLSAPPQSAKLRLFVINDGVEGGSVFLVSNNFKGTSTPWTQAALDFTNAPDLPATPINAFGAVGLNQTVEIDVTPAITGNGVYSFAISNNSTDLTNYNSKESANPPQLVIQTSGGSTNLPTITSFTPTSGAVGGEVTITGFNFTGATAVQFNGVNAPGFLVDSDSQIRVNVPSGATTGAISVTNGSGTGASASSFTIIQAQAPTVSSFNPTSGVVGANVTITGANFVSVSGVSFNGAAATSFTVDSPTQIRANVPSGATTGKISVTTAGGAAQSATDFTVLTSQPAFALSFDGSDDLAVILDNPLLSGGPGKSITVEAWVNMQDVSAEHNPIVAKYLNGSFKDWGLDIESGVLNVNIESTDEWSTQAGLVPVNKWTHLAFTFDNAANVVRLYVDGVEAGAGFELTRDMPDTEADIWLGAHSYNSNFRTFGIIDEVRIWNYPRSLAELQSAMNLKLNGTETGLIGYWPFDEGSGQLAADLTGNGNHARLGTSTGADISDPTWVTSPARNTLPMPSIAAFTPTSAEEGVSVTITGANFIGTTEIAFNGTPAASFTVDSDTQIRVTVPIGARTGRIRVTNAHGFGFSTTDFTVVVPPGTFTFTPQHDTYARGANPSLTDGKAGELRLEKDKFNSYLKFNVTGLDAPVWLAKLRLYVTDASVDGGSAYAISNNLADNITPWTESNLAWDNAPPLTPPPLSTLGPVSVGTMVEFNVTAAITGDGIYSFGLTNNSTDRAAYSSNDGTIAPVLFIKTTTSPPTTLQLISPNGGEGWPVASNQNITWASPGNLTNVKLEFSTNNGASWTTIAASTPDDGSFSWTVPNNVSSQCLVRVSDAADGDPLDVSDGVFAILTAPSVPVITSFTPTSGPVGAQVTILGSNFTGVTGVSFNGVFVSSFTFDSDSQVRASVPSGAATGPISVVNSAGAGLSPSNFTITTGGTSTLTFNPTDDAYVRSSNPNNNYGGGSDVRIRKANSGELTNSYFKFNVTGLSGPVSSAKIRLNVLDASDQGGAMYSVSNNLSGTTTPWTEGSIIFNNAPSISGSPLSALGQVTVGQTVEFNVTAAISGNGVFSFGMLSTSNDAAYYGSKEGGNGAQLVVESVSASSSNPPSISSFNPTSGAIGSQVTISGSNFDGTTGVSFNATSAPSFTIVSNSQIRATVPSGATTGPISVTNADGTAQSASNFTVLAPPDIISFTPTSGTVGATVTITGSNFTGLSSITFNGTAAIFILDSASQARATVPAGATSGPIIVANAAGSDASASNFTVTQAPSITSFTPTSAPMGTEITITGLNFTGTTSVAFNGLAASGFTVDSNTQIRAAVPVGASTGKISVTNSDGTGQSASDFTVILPPTISSFTPTTGPVGAQVTITGTNFIGVVDVAFNGVSAISFSFDSATQIRANVPTGASTGKITVTNVAGAAVSANDFTVGGGSSTLTFAPLADAYVRSSNPNTNYGGGIDLRVRTANTGELTVTYFKFTVTGLTSAVSSAKIRLAVTSTSNQGGSMFSVSNNLLGTATPWSESDLTFNNAPEISGSPLSSLARVEIGQTVEFDVTPAIAGNGTFSFGLNSTSNDAAIYSSKEGTIAPELVITTGALSKENSEALADGANGDETESNPILPETVELYPNYPNPFNAETTIEYALPKDARVKLAIFNIKGQLVRMLFDGEQRAGILKARWNGKNGDDKDVSSGVYFLRLEVGEHKLSRKITLQK